MYGSGPSAYYGFMNEASKTPPPLFLKGTRIQYMGLEAEVIKDNDNAAGLWGTSQTVLTFITIRFTGKAPSGWSRVQEVFARACSPVA